MDRTKALRYCAWLFIFLLLFFVPEKSSAQFGTDQTHTIAPTSVLFITGDVARPVAVSIGLIRNMPQVNLNAMNSETNKTELYSGVPLKDLLARAGVTAGDDLHGKAASLSVAAVGKDGNQVVLSPAETSATFHNGGQIIVADALDGKPLNASNGPLMLIVSGDTGSAHWVRNLARIQVHTAN